MVEISQTGSKLWICRCVQMLFPELFTQVTPASTNAALGPKRTAVQCVITATALPSFPSTCWSFASRTVSCWIVTTWALCCSSSRRQGRMKPSAPYVWPTHTCCSTPGEETWSSPSWPSCSLRSTSWSRNAGVKEDAVRWFYVGTSTLYPTALCGISSPPDSSTTTGYLPGWWVTRSQSYMTAGQTAVPHYILKTQHNHNVIYQNEVSQSVCTSKRFIYRCFVPLSDLNIGQAYSSKRLNYLLFYSIKRFKYQSRLL